MTDRPDVDASIERLSKRLNDLDHSAERLSEEFHQQLEAIGTERTEIEIDLGELIAARDSA
jgi:prefoldin subunit 5